MRYQSIATTAPETLQVPMTFHKGFPTLRFTREDLRIDYAIQKDRMLQSRYRGRALLHPRVDVENYKFEAVLDWIEISFEITIEDGPRQAKNIQNKLSRFLSKCKSSSTVFVSGSQRTKGYIGEFFLFRLQDPKPDELRALLRFIERQYRLEYPDGNPFRVVGVEIAFDAYPRDDGLLEDEVLDFRRWQMTNLFWRHIRFVNAYDEPNDAVRYFPPAPPREKVKPERMLRGKYTRKPDRDACADTKTARMLDVRNYRTVPTDATLCIGRKGGPVMFRIMDKITDGKDPSGKVRQVLGRNERRARIEVSLVIEEEQIRRGEGLHFAEINTPEQLFGFPFHEWRRTYFSFYLPTLKLNDGEIDDVECEMFEKAGVIGLEHYQAVRREIDEGREPANGIAKALGKKEYLVAHDSLNERAREALRGLSRRWK